MSDDTKKQKPEPQDLPPVLLEHSIRLMDSIDDPEMRHKAQAEICLQAYVPQIRAALYDVVTGKSGAVTLDIMKGMDKSGRTHIVGMVIAIGDLYTILQTTLEANVGSPLPPEVTPQ